MSSIAITKETYLKWYEEMLLMRKFEDKTAQLYTAQKIKGFCHLYNGQEAVAAGILSVLRPDDAVITSYRDHALALGKGISARECMAEMYGKVTGCAKGKGGSMHFFSKEHNFFGGHGIVGAQMPLGAGIAFANQYLGKDTVCVCLVGDGAVHQGALNETFNMAMLWKLPVIFICENNGYAMGTSQKRSTNKEIYKIGHGFDMPCEAVDGMNCEPVHEAVDRAVMRARAGEGPTFLEIRTYRYRGHSMSDPQKYRTKDEVEDYRQKDPIVAIKAKIEELKYADAEWFASVDKKVKEIVEDSVKFAEESPYPDNSELFTDVYENEYPFVRD